MRAIGMAALLALAGCGGRSETRSLSLVLDSDLAAGKATLTCRQSSSGTCHVLFVTGDKTLRLSAAAGSKAEINGVSADTQLCTGDSAPANGCRLTPLRDGEQIVRFTETKRS